MEAVFITNAVLDLAIVLILVYLAWMLADKGSDDKKNLVLVLALFYLLSGAMNVAWFLKFSSYASEQLILLESFFHIGKTALTLIIFSSILGNSRLLYYLVLYLVSAATARFGFDNFFLLMNFISFLLNLMVFIYVHHSRNRSLRMAGLFGMIYSVLSIGILVSFYGRRDIYSMAMGIPSILFACVAYYLQAYLRESEVPSFSRPEQMDFSLSKVLFVGIRLFVLVSLTFFIVLITTVSLHELGHAFAARMEGCGVVRAVLFDGNNLPHTAVVCPPDHSPFLIGLAGILFPLILGLGLLMVGETSTLGISYLLIGFSFYFSSKDLSDLNLPGTITILVAILSIVFLLLGIQDTLGYFFHEEGMKHISRHPEAR